MVLSMIIKDFDELFERVFGTYPTFSGAVRYANRMEE